MRRQATTSQITKHIVFISPFKPSMEAIYKYPSCQFSEGRFQLMSSKRNLDKMENISLSLLGYSSAEFGSINDFLFVCFEIDQF